MLLRGINKLSTVLAAIFCVSLLISCASDVQVEKLDPHDPYIGLTKDDYRDILIKKAGKASVRKPLKVEREELNIPRMSKLLVTPPPPPIGTNELVSLAVTKDVPLSDVLIELGRIAKIDVEMDNDIEGGIVINVKDKPLKVVLDRICALGDLRYSYNNGILRFENDRPYTRNYRVDYLSNGDLWSAVESSVGAIIDDNRDEDENTSVSTNKPAGVITVYGDSKVQRRVNEYIRNVNENVSSQVLIEAKVVEVNLKDEFNAGINWEWLSGSGNSSVNQGGSIRGIDSNGNPTISLPDSGGLDVTKIGSGVFGGTLDITVSMLEQFGTTRTLSSPRLATVNNQKANLSFTDKLIYFTTEVEEEDVQQSDGTIQVRKTFSYTKEEEEVGVELEIIPSIDLATNEITMDVKPDLSIQVGTVQEPNVDLQEAGITNEIPVVQRRTFETVMKIKSGETMVLGGLIQNSTSNTETGVPFFMDIPVLGHFFKSTSRSENVTETVVFIKATILNSRSGVSEKDQEFYNNFNNAKEINF